MNDELKTFRVSARFLRNLWQQAIFGAIGALVSWGVFWSVSQLLLPTPEIVSPDTGPIRPRDLNYWVQPHENREREILRFFVGPVLAIFVLFGGLIDFQTWIAVRYEIRPDRLRMCWRWWARDIEWDVMQGIDERPHPVEDLHSLSISAASHPPILVRGLERMPEFLDIVRSRTSKLTKWTIAPLHIDLTRRLTNFVIGALLPVPIFGTWLLYYVANCPIAALMVAWSVSLVPAAIALWYTMPLSRRHNCAREVEVLLAVLMLILSGLLSLVSWVDSPYFMRLMNGFF